jgi:histidinol-phosphate aminotransferase
VLATRGSDEAIDLLSRIYLRAGSDAICSADPTFGMYQVSARIQGAESIEMPLRARARLGARSGALLAAWQPQYEARVLCSPNNPTANLLEPRPSSGSAMALDGKAIVVIDEAYIEWSRSASLTRGWSASQTLAILRTCRRRMPWPARASARCSHPELIQLAKRIIRPTRWRSPRWRRRLRALGPR